MPIKTFEKQLTGTEVFQLNWNKDYLKPLNDSADTLLAFSSDPGITVVPQVTVGNPVTGGVLLFRASGGALDESYTVRALLKTVQGREKPAVVVIKVVAD